MGAPQGHFTMVRMAVGSCSGLLLRGVHCDKGRGLVRVLSTRGRSFVSTLNLVRWGPVTRFSWCL